MSEALQFQEADFGRLAPPSERKSLLDICQECFLLLIHLRSTDEFGEPARLRERINTMLNRLEETARVDNYTTDEIKIAMFALVAFIDECLVNSNWPSKTTWVQNPLQMELFNVNDAGDQFFEILDRLHRAPRENRSVLEVYFQCLSLGFRGRYFFQDGEALRRIIERTAEDVRTQLDDQKLSPNGARPDSGEGVARQIPIWVVPAVVAAICALVYLTAQLLIENKANDILRLIS